LFTLGDIMKKSILPLIILLVLSIICTAAAGDIRVISINGSINPITSEYVIRNIKEAARHHEQFLVVDMDTPGGLDTSMREIIKEIFASPVPIVVYVSPAGARAASAGALIAMSADVCAMASGTNIGAAHPVTVGEQPDKVMENKILNDAEAYVEGIARKRGRNIEIAKKMVRESISISAEKALEEGVIDLIASNRADLLRKLDGRSIVMGDGKKVVLKTAGTRVQVHEMSTREKILNTISNPNVAYILMMLGMLGLFFELANPGVILPGVIGGISLILAFFAFQTLPVNYAGVLLILLALILFIAEIKIVSGGMLTVGGVISMILGSLLLFESPEPYLRVSWSVILVTVLAVSGFALFVITKAVKAHHAKPTSGREGLIGEEGKADSDISPEGKVFVRGEYWDAFSDESISRGERIVVIDVEGMTLKVRKAGILHGKKMDSHSRIIMQ
jgi:membrane-bound serine protease (ClpP class)